MPTRREPTTALAQPLLVAAGLVCANALIWFLGPLLTIAGWRPLDGELSRWSAMTAFALLAIAALAVAATRQVRRNRELLDGLVRPQAGAAPGAHDLAVIGRRFEEAIAQLRRGRLGAKRRLPGVLSGQPFVYQLPWYVIIGAPGAGKTTALANSALEFPLAGTLGRRGVRGIGGTRNCDWWFTTDAVLIDTAGRFTTQDSDQAADQAAWFGFLDLLRKHRPRQPINGVLLTLSVGDLLTARPDEQQEHARKLRDRLEEIQARLGAGIPIYVLVTKLDLLAGFVEFFGDFDKDERAQVWGVTFPWNSGPAASDPLARMPGELVALEKRLDERLIERLTNESDRERRAAIYAFPQQWRVLRETLVDVLQKVFAVLPAQHRQLMRGIYFTSATQEGTPMDRALGGLARTLGLASRVVAPARPSGKAFFVTRLLREVLFAEAGLVGANLRWRRRRLALEWSVLVATAAGVAVALALLWRGYAASSDLLATTDERLAELEREAVRARSSPPTELLAILPVLDGLQALGGNPAEANSVLDAAWLRRFAGIDQRAAIEGASHDAYLQLLREALLPRIAVRLEARLRRGARENLDSLYEAVKAYQMLFIGRYYDRHALASSLRADWDLTLPASADTEAGVALRRHVDRLLASGEVGAPVQADQELIAEARRLVGSVPLAQRAYIRLQKIDPQVIGTPAAPDIDVITMAGPAADQVFARESGRPLSQGISHIFSPTVHGRLRQLSEAVLRQLSTESGWVLGSDAKPLDSAEVDRLYADIEQRYLSDYLRRWDELLGDLRIVPTTDLARSAQVTQILSRNDSPLLALLNATAQHLPAEIRAPKTPLSRSLAADAAALPERFEALLRLLTDQRSTLQEALDLLARLSSHLTAVDDALRRKAPLPSSSVTREFSALVARLPEPLRSMLAQLASASAAQLFDEQRDALGQLLSAEVGAPCARLVHGRYPFTRGGKEEISRADFARTFAAAGLLDGFFQRQLAPYAEMSASGWTFPTGNAKPAPSEALQHFQRAQLIRSAMFSDGGRTLGVRLEFRLLELDPTITAFEIDVDGQPMRFARDTRAPLAVRWPDAGASVQGVRLAVVSGMAAGTASKHVFDGPWALLRLFERVRVEPDASTDRIKVVIDIEGRRARFEIRSAAPVNPLRLAALQQFRCPQQL